MADEPQWMEEAAPAARVRTGATPHPRSGLSTFLFLGGLAAAVGLAGAIGIAIWGPENSRADHHYSATDSVPPGSSVALASSASTATANAPQPVETSASAPPSVEPTPSSAPPPKKKRRKSAH